MRWAPQACSASCIEDGPSPSPAWQVQAMPWPAAYSNAARCSPAGCPRSGPARSNATSPEPRYVAAARASSSDSAGGRGRVPPPSRPDLGPGFPLGPSDPGERRLDRLRERERRPVQQRRVAHLHVPDAVGRGVHHELVRDPLERRRGLHDGEGDLVLGEILLEALGVLHVQRLGESGRRVRRQPHPLLPRQLEHRLGPETAVQVHVQLRLGPAPQQLLGHPRGSAPFARRHHHAENRAAFTDHFARIHRAPHTVGRVRGAARQQAGQVAVERLHCVPHGRSPGHRYGLFVHEDAQAHRARWMRSSAGGSTGDRSSERYRISASRSTSPASSAGRPRNIVNPLPPAARKSLTATVYVRPSSTPRPPARARLVTRWPARLPGSYQTSSPETCASAPAPPTRGSSASLSTFPLASSRTSRFWNGCTSYRSP